MAMRALILCFLFFQLGFSQDLVPFQRNENIWVYLARTVMNTTDFCLSAGTYVGQTFTSCLVGVCTPLELISNFTLFKNIVKNITYKDIYNWGPVVRRKEHGMFSIDLKTVTPSQQCVQFMGCSLDCQSLDNTVLNCSKTETVSYANRHIKLPSGWFLLCGHRAFSYVPANASGGPCSLGRLTTFLPRRQDLDVKKSRVTRETELSADCRSDLRLFSTAEYVALSLFAMPAMVISLNVQVSRLACSMAKALNATSQAISALSVELGQVREAVLENRAAIDYLLLLHNRGCEEFKGMCCFNISDNSELVEQKLKDVKNVIQNIKQRDGFFGINVPDWFSWLLNLGWLRTLIAGIGFLLILGILICCCIQLSPCCITCCKTCSTLITPQVNSFKRKTNAQDRVIVST